MSQTALDFQKLILLILALIYISLYLCRFFYKFIHFDLFICGKTVLFYKSFLCLQYEKTLAAQTLHTFSTFNLIWISNQWFVIAVNYWCRLWSLKLPLFQTFVTTYHHCISTLTVLCVEPGMYLFIIMFHWLNSFLIFLGRFIGQAPDGILLDPDDSFWCQALEDLETCGQSELLREIEVCWHPWIDFIT